MESGARIRLDELQRALTPGALRPLQIIQIALGAGVAVFFLVVLAVFLAQPQSEAASPVEVLQVPAILSAFNLVYFLLSVSFAQRMFMKTLSKGPLPGQGPDGKERSPEDRLIGRIQQAYVARSAILDGSAFLALAALLISARFGALRLYPVLWINALPAVLFLSHLMRNFPTPEEVERALLDRFSE